MSLSAGVLARLEEIEPAVRRRVLRPNGRRIADHERRAAQQLIRDHDEYLRLLSELEVAQNELIASTEESEAFIDERVLWIRSSDPIGLAHFSQAWAELHDLAQPAEWAAVSMAIKNRVVQRPLLAVLAILAVFLMILCRDRFRRQINRICDAEPDELRGHFWPTLEAIVAAALATAFWPGLIWLVGWQLKTTQAMPDLGIAVGQGLESAAYAFWLCRFARQLCRQGSIAERHFQWSARSVALARRNLSWLSSIGIPCVFFISAVTVYRDGEWSSFLGRIASSSAWPRWPSLLIRHCAYATASSANCPTIRRTFGFTN